MEVDMRSRRNIIASAIITASTVGSVIAGPVLALTNAVTPAATGVAAMSMSPNVTLRHG
jgi:hypothetical protein